MIEPRDMEPCEGKLLDTLPDSHGETVIDREEE